MSKEYAKTVVAAGITFLDQHNAVPRDWRSKIDVEKLDTSSDKLCPLGQIFGDYYDGSHKLGINGTGKVFAHGFCGSNGADSDELDEAWKAALKDKYSIGDKLVERQYSSNVSTIKAAFMDGDVRKYVIVYDLGGSYIRTEGALDNDYKRHVPFQFVNGDILTNKDRNQFFVVRDGERRLERLGSAYSSAPQTRNGEYDYYASEYGELVALVDSTFKKFSEV